MENKGIEGFSMKIEQIIDDLDRIEKEIKHKEYELRQLKAEWDKVYSQYLKIRRKDIIEYLEEKLN